MVPTQVAFTGSTVGLEAHLEGVEVRACGELQKPFWTVRKTQGGGAISSGDEVTFTAEGLSLAMCGEWAVALKGEQAEKLKYSKFIVEIKDHPAPMRVGFKGLFTDGFEDVAWFGRGPHESYMDRYASARIGIFQGSILDQTVKYVRPQENGNKFDTRWMCLKRPAGSNTQCAGILISATKCSDKGGNWQRDEDPPRLGMQCHRYLSEDFDGGPIKTSQRVLHSGELVACAETSFCIDAAQMGVGGIDSWGRRPLEEHMISGSQEFDWAFELRPLTKEEVQKNGEVFNPPARRSPL